MSPTKDRRDFSSHEELICTLPKSVATPLGQDCRPPSRPIPAAFGTCRNILQRELIAAWSVDRLGRSLQDLVSFLTEVHALGINLFLHQQGIDTTTPAGKALFQMMGVFAEFERAMIRERVKSGLERAKAQGKILGRPRIDPRREAAILDDLREGKAGIIKLAATQGVGVGTVQRIKASLPLGL